MELEAGGIDEKPHMDTAHRCVNEKLCSAERCSRPCQSRQNGTVSIYCGTHCCEIGNCDEMNTVGRLCHAHVCNENGCSRVRGGGRFCDHHTCRRGDCTDGHGGFNFCQIHRCIETGCRDEAQLNTYCTGHGVCPETGCSRRRELRDSIPQRTCRERKYHPPPFHSFS